MGTERSVEMDHGVNQLYRRETQIPFKDEHNRHWKEEMDIGRWT